MALFSPQPRFKIYSSFNTFFSYFASLFIADKNSNSIQALESEIQNRFKISHAICMPQARVAIYFAIKHLVKPGQKVILSPYTIADVVNMVICAGGQPVFADIDRKTCNIDPNEINRLVDNDTGAVLVTHLHGLACPMDEIKAICKTAGVYLIEDAAQAFGAKYNGNPVGTFGDAGIFSFGRYKNIISFYGGMMVTPHEDLNHKVRNELAKFPQIEKMFLFRRALGCLIKAIATTSPIFPLGIYPIFRFGHLKHIKLINKIVETEIDLNRKNEIPEIYLKRMNHTQAKMVLKKIDDVEGDTISRIHKAHIYYEGLKDITKFIVAPYHKDFRHIYTFYPIQYAERRKLVYALMQAHRDVGLQHLKNCADLPAFRDFYRDCPNARATANEVVLLPTYPQYSDGQAEKNINAIYKFL